MYEIIRYFIAHGCPDFARETDQWGRKLDATKAGANKKNIEIFKKRALAGGEGSVISLPDPAVKLRI